MASNQVRGFLKMYSSYKTLFRIKFKIYKLGDYNLARPIPLDAGIAFLLLLFPSYFLAHPVAIIFNQPRVGVAVLLSGLLTWMIMKWDPQGRPFMGFAYDFIAFLIRPKRRDFTGKVISKHRKARLYWNAYDLE